MLGYGTVTCTRVMLTYPVAPEGRSAIILVGERVGERRASGSGNCAPAIGR